MGNNKNSRPAAPSVHAQGPPIVDKRTLIEQLLTCSVAQGNDGVRRRNGDTVTFFY
jgi:hypothetical protein